MSDVILVDEKNNEIDTMEKMEAHRKGLLHRAFSIFVFNSRGELLIQKRNSQKYHSGGLWSNTVCSHPVPGETYEVAVHRRLKEEMGFDCSLEQKTCFVYKAPFDNGLTEHEYDCVFTGVYDGEILPNAEEVEDFAWTTIDALAEKMKHAPNKYTFWLRKIVSEHLI